MQNRNTSARLAEDGEERRCASRNSARDCDRAVFGCNAEISHRSVDRLGFDGGLDVTRVGLAGDGVEECSALGRELFFGIDDSEDVVGSSGFALGAEFSCRHQVETIRSGFELDFDSLDD